MLAHDVCGGKILLTLTRPPYATESNTVMDTFYYIFNNNNNNPSYLAGIWTKKNLKQKRGNARQKIKWNKTVYDWMYDVVM